jgi:hypothetical protein
MSEDMLRWKGTIKGPKETPCDGCTFAIDIDIELTNYPYEPPKMKFDTTVQALLAEHLAENTSGLYKGFPVELHLWWI